jgi:cellulose synthase/poly-beta-1,6-N-acetylglucosamine synthase-like glycosyltransferase
MTRIAVLVLAHNESGVIGRTVSSVLKSLSSGDAIFVVADNCSDETASRAREAGAQVFIRSTGPAAGKAKALAWFVKEFEPKLHGYSMLVILDADSTVKPGFGEEIKVNSEKDGKAFQCFVYPLYDESPISKLAALSEYLDQSISDKIRSTLGWPVRLRGTGMVITPDVLKEVCGKLQTEVEDIALTILLVSAGINIRRIDKALVFDQKPLTSAAAAQQRARWYRGQWLAMWSYRKEIVGTFFQGPGAWSLLSSLFLRPKWLIILIDLLLAVLLVRWPWIAIPFWIYLLASLIYLVYGLIQIPERRIFIRALLYSPAYVWMWLHGINLALRPSSWRRAR